MQATAQFLIARLLLAIVNRRHRLSAARENTDTLTLMRGPALDCLLSTLNADIMSRCRRGPPWASVEITLERIRREHFVKGKTIKEISRTLGCPGTRCARYCVQGRRPSSTSEPFNRGRSWGNGRFSSTKYWKAMRSNLLASS
jgi:hypothetical protein